MRPASSTVDAESRLFAAARRIWDNLSGNGTTILIFTQSDSDGREKRYVHQQGVYNIHNYFQSVT